RHASRAEEGGLAQIRAIDELVDHHEHARIEFAMERTAGGKRDDVGDAGALERVDIGAIVDRRRREPVAAAALNKKDGVSVPNAAEAQGVGRFAPRRRYVLLAQILQSGKMIDARSADHSDNRLRHGPALFVGGRQPPFGTYRSTGVLPSSPGRPRGPRASTTF